MTSDLKTLRALALEDGLEPLLEAAPSPWNAVGFAVLRDVIAELEPCMTDVSRAYMQEADAMKKQQLMTVSEGLAELLRLAGCGAT